MDLKSYSATMERNMEKIQDNMSQFSKNLTLVQNGRKNFPDIRANIENIEREVNQIILDINSIQPPENYKTLHETVNEGSEFYLQGLQEFLKFYTDNNDEHFIEGGLKIKKGTEQMNKASKMF